MRARGGQNVDCIAVALGRGVMRLVDDNEQIGILQEALGTGQIPSQAADRAEHDVIGGVDLMKCAVTARHDPNSEAVALRGAGSEIEEAPCGLPKELVAVRHPEHAVLRVLVEPPGKQPLDGRPGLPGTSGHDEHALEDTRGLRLFKMPVECGPRFELVGIWP